MRHSTGPDKAKALPAFAALGLLGAAAAAGFPPVTQLPPRPELPDPLQTFDGKRVADREQWFRQRRPELKELF